MVVHSIEPHPRDACTSGLQQHQYVLNERLAMVKRYTILTAVVCSLLVFALPIVGQSNEELKIKYDRFKDETTVGISLGKIEPGWGDSVTHIIAATHPGQKPQVSSSTKFTWMITAPRIPPYGKTELILLVDEARIRLEGAASSGGSSRVAMIPINLDTLRRVSNANVVEGQVGKSEFKLTPEDREKIATFLKYFAVGSPK